MIGSLIGLGVSAAGSIFGGYKASQAMKKYRSQVLESKKNNDNWYNRNYNEDATQTASAQSLLNHTEERIKNRNRAAAGAAAVTGATEESVAATKAANNEMMADAVSRIAANAERRRERVEEHYMARDNQLQDQLNQIEAGRANSIAEATKGVIGAAGSLGSLIDDYAETKKAAQNPAALS